MRFLPYILKHLRHNWFRTALTVLAMALCIFLFCVLETAIDAINSSTESASDKRLIARHAVSLVFNLPIYYGPRIAAVPGVRRVAGANWFGGIYQDRKNFFPNFAIDAEPYLAIYPEYILPPEQRDAFLRDPRGAIVGRETAERFGWKPGDVIQMESTIPPYRTGRPFEFVIRGIYDSDPARFPGTNLQQLFFHYRYLYESTGRRVGKGTFVVEIDDPARAGAVSREVDALFENSTAQTKTETEAAFRASFIALIGNIALLLRVIGLATTFTILLVTANTMSMAVRERRKEIATLKTLGFSGKTVMGLVLGEAVLLGLLGGGLGLLLGDRFIHVLPKIPMVGDIFRGVADRGLSPELGALAFGLAVALGAAAGFLPALLAYRERITSALRQL
ncbi:MAG: ABC transporter permease [Acidobacteria bacterium]|jgi:putative ABC transport system permease protein|nr:ABC transporter permease [Acidobacteriota bacterium]